MSSYICGLPRCWKVLVPLWLRWRVWLREALFLCDLCLPFIEDFLHLRHPLRAAGEVVFDGAVSEGDKVVLFVVWRNGKILQLRLAYLTTPLIAPNSQTLTEEGPRSGFCLSHHNCRSASTQSSHPATERTTLGSLLTIRNRVYQLPFVPYPSTLREPPPIWIRVPARSQNRIALGQR